MCLMECKFISIFQMKIMNKGHFLTGSMLSEQHVYNLPQGQIPQSRQVPGILRNGGRFSMKTPPPSSFHGLHRWPHPAPTPLKYFKDFFLKKWMHNTHILSMNQHTMFILFILLYIYCHYKNIGYGWKEIKSVPNPQEFYHTPVLNILLLMI